MRLGNAARIAIISYGITFAIGAIIFYRLNGRKFSWPPSLDFDKDIKILQKDIKILQEIKSEVLINFLPKISKAGSFIGRAALQTGAFAVQFGLPFIFTLYCNKKIRKVEKKKEEEGDNKISKTQQIIIRFTIEAVVSTTLSAAVSFVTRYSFRNAMKVNLVVLSILFIPQFLIRKGSASSKFKKEIQKDKQI